MSPFYVRKVHTIGGIESKQWVNEFANWGEMSLRSEIELYKDFVLVAPNVWLKLYGLFGGAPDIMLQNVEKPVVKLELPEKPEFDYDENGDCIPYALSQTFID